LFDVIISEIDSITLTNEALTDQVNQFMLVSRRPSMDPIAFSALAAAAQASIVGPAGSPVPAGVIPTLVCLLRILAFDQQLHFCFSR
jgi:hypothetical protein